MPSTTVAPAATSSTALTDGQQAVLEQVGVTEAAYDMALRNPDDETLVAAIEVATVEGSPAREEFVRAYQSHIAQGRWAVADTEVANSVAAIGPPTIVGDGSVAVVTVCHVSGDTLMGVDAAGRDKVLADSRNARLILQTFHLVHDAWKLFLREQLAIIPEGTSCEVSVDPPPSVH
jgi:hypothetical protein